MTHSPTFDVAVVGGGPSGATAANDLARLGYHVLLLDRAGRIKPCGGAIPPRLIIEFEIPDQLLVARISSARMVSPTDQQVDMPIEGGFVGMVDRDVFDEWLRERAVRSGAERRTGAFREFTRDKDGVAVLNYESRDAKGTLQTTSVRARTVIGADGAVSAVARQCIPGAESIRYVFAYHEIVRSPEPGHNAFNGKRCDVIYRGKLSPDFYSWIFPHGATTSIGTGSACKGFSLRGSVSELRQALGLGQAATLRREGAPIPLEPLKRWDNGRDVVLAGDAAGVVAPASGEGIYYAMASGRIVADAVHHLLRTGDARELARARKRFMHLHGGVFWILGLMQRYWYTNDNRRERFVAICRDRDVQQLTWDAYMNKALVRARPLSHVRIFFKNIAHLTGLAQAT
jgi:geranylgeranyl diphosphate/geranylgeranyl-bacteriochlorophyllide a reductase